MGINSIYNLLSGQLSTQPPPPDDQEPSAQPADTFVTGAPPKAPDSRLFRYMDRPGLKKPHRLKLKSGGDYRWSNKFKPDLAKLETMLEEIASRQFRDDPHRMTVWNMATTAYTDPRGALINSKRLLNHYSHARYLADHPDNQDAGQKFALAQDGYSAEASLKFFIRSLFGDPKPIEADYQLQSGLDYDWSRRAKPDQPRLETMLREILQLQFGNEPRQMKAGPIRATTYLGPNDNIIEGEKILNHYRHALWIADHEGKPDPGRTYACKQTGYTDKDSINYFLENIIKAQGLPAKPSMTGATSRRSIVPKLDFMARKFFAPTTRRLPRENLSAAIAPNSQKILSRPLIVSPHRIFPAQVLIRRATPQAHRFLPSVFRFSRR